MSEQNQNHQEVKPRTTYGQPAQSYPDKTEAKSSATDSPAKAVGKTEEKRDVSLTNNRLKQAEFTRTVYTATIERGHIKSDLIDPKFWAHVAIKLRRGDRVECTSEDGSFYAELMVLACDRTWAKMHVLQWHDLSSSAIQLTPEILAEYLVDFKGPDGWCVIRKSDNQTLQSKLFTEDEAKRWIEGFVRNMRAA